MQRSGQKKSQIQNNKQRTEIYLHTYTDINKRKSKQKSKIDIKTNKQKYIHRHSCIHSLTQKRRSRRKQKKQINTQKTNKINKDIFETNITIYIKANKQ